MTGDKNSINIILEVIRSFKEENSKAHSEIKTLIKEQNGRVRKLENWRIYLTGIAVGAGLIAGVSGKYIIEFFTTKI